MQFFIDIVMSVMVITMATCAPTLSSAKNVKIETFENKATNDGYEFS